MSKGFFLLALLFFLALSPAYISRLEEPMSAEALIWIVLIALLALCFLLRVRADRPGMDPLWLKTVCESFWQRLCASFLIVISEMMQIFGAVVSGSGGLVIGYQVLLWLDTGRWTQLNLFGLLYPTENLLMKYGLTAEDLACNAVHWRGLYRLWLEALYYTPLSLFLFVAGGVLWLVAALHQPPQDWDT